MAELKDSTWRRWWYGLTAGVITFFPALGRAEANTLPDPQVPPVEVLREYINTQYKDNPEAQQAAWSNAASGNLDFITDEKVKAAWQQELGRREAEKAQEKSLQENLSEAKLKMRAQKAGNDWVAKFLKITNVFAKVKTAADLARGFVALITGIDENGKPVAFWDALGKVESDINQLVTKLFESGSLAAKIREKGMEIAKKEAAYNGLIDHYREGAEQSIALELAKKSPDQDKINAMLKFQRELKKAYINRSMIPQVEAGLFNVAAAAKQARGR